MFSTLYCLRQVVSLCYELLVVLIWLWEILVAFEGILRFGPVLLLMICLTFLPVLFRWGFLVEQVFWVWFLSIKVVCATSKCKECIQHPCVIHTKSPGTSLPNALQRCVRWLLVLHGTSTVETQDKQNCIPPLLMHVLPKGHSFPGST